MALREKFELLANFKIGIVLSEQTGRKERRLESYLKEKDTFC
jgi:hypothetical protein